MQEEANSTQGFRILGQLSAKAMVTCGSPPWGCGFC
jgi:hypothetical protein